MGMRTADGRRGRLGDDDISDWSTRRRRGGRHRLHPGGPAPARPAARGAAVGEPDPRPPDPAAQRPRAADRPAGARARHRADRRDYDVRTPGIDVTASRAVRRQPAEAHRRPRDERRARGCSSPRTRPAAWTSARRRRSGTHIRAARRGGPRGAADLRRPRRADRPVRHAAGDPARPAGRDADPATVTPEELGSAMTGADGEPRHERDRHALDATAGEPPPATADAAGARPARSAWCWRRHARRRRDLLGGPASAGEPGRRLHAMIGTYGRQRAPQVVNILNKATTLLPVRPSRWPSASG